MDRAAVLDRIIQRVLVAAQLDGVGKREPAAALLQRNDLVRVHSQLGFLELRTGAPI
ncbi:MAG: hypothetical protein H0X65_23820 [Gemmatimonadetes bacterium]|nr:hypothetical protein [Gemmatimonadota bacterium]